MWLSRNKSAQQEGTFLAGEPQNWSKVSFDRSEQRAKAWGKQGMDVERLPAYVEDQGSSGNDASPQQTSSLLAIPFWCSYTVLKTKSHGIDTKGTVLLVPSEHA
jgi:hypothetical protein